MPAGIPVFGYQTENTQDWTNQWCSWIVRWPHVGQWHHPEFVSVSCIHVSFIITCELIMTWFSVVVSHFEWKWHGDDRHLQMILMPASCEHVIFFKIIFWFFSSLWWLWWRWRWWWWWLWWWLWWWWWWWLFDVDSLEPISSYDPNWTAHCLHQSTVAEEEEDGIIYTVVVRQHPSTPNRSLVRMHLF